MSPKNSSKKSYHYVPSEGFELRSRLRLQRDLGIDQDFIDYFQDGTINKTNGVRISWFVGSRSR